MQNTDNIRISHLCRFIQILKKTLFIIILKKKEFCFLISLPCRSFKPSPRKMILHEINRKRDGVNWTRKERAEWGNLNKLPFNATIRAALRDGKWKLITGKAGRGVMGEIIFVCITFSLQKLFGYQICHSWVPSSGLVVCNSFSFKIYSNFSECHFQN